jgi:hypothetical protein
MHNKMISQDYAALDSGLERRARSVQLPDGRREDALGAFDSSNPVGERTKVIGENAHLQMAARQHALQRTLSGVLGVSELSERQHRAAQGAMTPRELMAFPRMKREEVINLGVDIAERLGWLRTMEP